MSQRGKILVVEDEEKLRDKMKILLEGEGYEVSVAGNGEEGLKKLNDKSFNLAITDLMMPVMDGHGFLREVKESFPTTEVIILTGHGTVDSAVEALKMGAVDYLSKPVSFDEMKIVIDKVVRNQNMRNELELLRGQLKERSKFHHIVGRSKKMQEIFDLIEMVADTDSNVLIRGESGTGKELIAGAIHYNSPRAQKPFIKVNCAGLAEGLLDSEMFGHEKGAFTGAYKRKIGRFELADGGTLFLDEIGDISPSLQAKLLRVLQEREFERVGGTETIRVDVRLIAATNMDLQEGMKEKKFREDLYCRLNVVGINIPPLRDRVEDIGLLVDHFLGSLRNKNPKKILGFSPESLSLLTGYNYPGNIRELENVIERAFILTKGDLIGPNDLPAELVEANMHLAEAEEGPERSFLNNRIKSSATFRTLKDIEKWWISHILEEAKGEKKKAAEILGLTRPTLYKKIKEYGL